MNMTDKTRMLGLAPLHPAPPVEVPPRPKVKPVARMVALNEVIERLEQGFGKGCAPVTTLLHHFGDKP